MNTLQFLAYCAECGIPQERVEIYIQQTQQAWFTEEDAKILKEV